MRKLILYCFFLCMAGTTQAQNLDSLIGLRKTSFLSGKIPTYYSPGSEKSAIDLQALVSSAATYYESLYGKVFHLKLAVLDSSQWLKEILPYGFLFYEEGWMVMNSGMQYTQFIQVYGLEDFSDKLDSALEAEHITSESLIQSFNEVYAIHEVGHYFIHNLSNCKEPDRWNNEFIATYFSYQYFRNNNSTPLTAFELFSKTDRDFIKPKYTSIKDLNEIYEGMGVKNYLWYHSNLFFLVKSLYHCYGTDFFPKYEKWFPKNAGGKLSQEEIINRLDLQCEGIVRKWVQALESTSKL